MDMKNHYADEHADINLTIRKDQWVEMYRDRQVYSLMDNNCSFNTAVYLDGQFFYIVGRCDDELNMEYTVEGFFATRPKEGYCVTIMLRNNDMEMSGTINATIAEHKADEAGNGELFVPEETPDNFFLKVPSGMHKELLYGEGFKAFYKFSTRP